MTSEVKAERKGRPEQVVCYRLGDGGTSVAVMTMQLESTRGEEAADWCLSCELAVT